ncbi:hypothetical protein [Streptomyces beigongshangae]|uniref:hypothetical protein n=1 Tax=Streptomyces beigongshangae TaxID=2841597 RepID=UPI001C85248F|nr:hypothetical protein [Streptomyces sp. REN17]
MTDNRVLLELVVPHGTDIKEDLDAISEGLEVTDEGRSRFDPVTVFGICAGVVGLVDALFSLADRLRRRRPPPRVEVRNEEGDTLVLVEVTRDELEQFLRREAPSDES